MNHSITCLKKSCNEILSNTKFFFLSLFLFVINIGFVNGRKEICTISSRGL